MNCACRQYLTCCRFVNMVYFAEYFSGKVPIIACISIFWQCFDNKLPLRRADGEFVGYLGFFIVREMRCFLSSASSTHTVTTSPTDSTSEGWRIKRSQICEICTSPS